MSSAFLIADEAHPALLKRRHFPRAQKERVLEGRFFLEQDGVLPANRTGCLRPWFSKGPGQLQRIVLEIGRTLPFDPATGLGPVFSIKSISPAWKMTDSSLGGFFPAFLGNENQLPIKRTLRLIQAMRLPAPARQPKTNPGATRFPGPLL